MPITQMEKPCWEPVCDGCGVGDNADYETPFHHPDLATAIESLEACEWTVLRNDDGSVRAIYCETCWDNLGEQAREGVQPGDPPPYTPGSEGIARRECE